MSRYDSYTVEPHDRGRFAVYGHGTYERSSVLAGRPLRAFLDGFDSVEDALKAYPKAELVGHSTRSPFAGSSSLGDLSGLPDCPPRWFDSADAGEAWHENDY